LKTRSAVEPFAEVIRTLNAEDRILATSFDEPTRQAVVKLLPAVASSTSQSMVIWARVRSWWGLPIDNWRVPPEVVALQIPPAMYGVALVTPSMIRLAKRRGLEVHVWTINDPDDMRRLWSMGVQGIITDRTDLAVQVRSELFPD
ncbi:MAG TPA: glycerophosphodiester phosphodiesterase family protein, partial [Pontimonas sp.]|nr:glycerophosphodiester phosphodiesterase family protein [Pontimonas sp.]